MRVQRLRGMLPVLIAPVAVAAVSASFVFVPSNIDPVDKYSWSENAGWMNWRDANGGADGVFVAADHLSGYIWLENAGWLNVGDGNAPYANTDGTNFGVNILGSGDLDGMAWGENIGWVNFGWAANTTDPDRARFDSGSGRFRGYAWSENRGWINLDDDTHFVRIQPLVVALDGCANDFEGASGGDGGERLNRFGCVAAPTPPATAGSPATAMLVSLHTMYNTNPSKPDGANACPPNRTRAGLDQFAGQVRYLGEPVEYVDDSSPAQANYIAAPLLCTDSEAAVRDWSPAGLEADFGTDVDTSRIYFYGPAVVPCSIYAVRHCVDPGDEGTCSDAALVYTAKLGDVWLPFDLVAATQPNVVDITKLVDKFRGVAFTPGSPPAGAPIEPRALLRDNVVAGLGKLLNVVDITNGIDGFRGLPYKENGPCDPSGVDECGNACDPSAGD